MEKVKDKLYQAQNLIQECLTLIEPASMDTNGIFASSEALKSVRKADRRWETIDVWQSFTIPLDEAKLENLRTKCWAMEKKLNKRFRVVKHETCYEIGRIE